MCIIDQLKIILKTTVHHSADNSLMPATATNPNGNFLLQDFLIWIFDFKILHKKDFCSGNKNMRIEI